MYPRGAAPRAPRAPKTPVCSPAGRWVVASPFRDSSGPSRGRDGLLIEGDSASSRAEKCHLPPRPHACPGPRTGASIPSCAPGLGRTPSLPISPLWDGETEASRAHQRAGRFGVPPRVSPRPPSHPSLRPAGVQRQAPRVGAAPPAPQHLPQAAHAAPPGHGGPALAHLPDPGAGPVALREAGRWLLRRRAPRGVVHARRQDGEGPCAHAAAAHGVGDPPLGRCPARSRGCIGFIWVLLFGCSSTWP